MKVPQAMFCIFFFEMPSTMMLERLNVWLTDTTAILAYCCAARIGFDTDVVGAVAIKLTEATNVLEWRKNCIFPMRKLFLTKKDPLV